MSALEKQGDSLCGTLTKRFEGPCPITTTIYRDLQELKFLFLEKEEYARNKFLNARNKFLRS